MSYNRKNTTLSVAFDDKGLKDILSQLHPDSQIKLQDEALKEAAGNLVKMSRADARADGLAQRKQKSNDGWIWQTYGRIPAAITAGKPWKRRNGRKQRGIRIYVSSSKSKGFLKRAFHSSAVIAGYTQYIPKRNGSSVPSGERKAPRPIFGRATRSAPSLLVPALNNRLNKLIKRLNKKYGGP